MAPPGTSSRATTGSSAAGSRKSRRTLNRGTKMEDLSAPEQAKRSRATISPQDFRKTVQKANQGGARSSGKLVDENKMKTWQKKWRRFFEQYYHEGDPRPKHSDAFQEAQVATHRPDMPVEVHQCLSPGCDYEASWPSHDPVFCCKECSRGKKHGPKCEKKEMKEVETAMVAFLEGVPDDLHDVFLEAHDLMAVRKLNLGHNIDITIEDVNNLHEKLQGNQPFQIGKDDEDETGDTKLSLETVHLMLTHCLEPPASEVEVDALLADYGCLEDKPRDWSNHKVSVIELYKLLTRGISVDNFYKLRKERHKEITRDYFCEHVADEVNKRDYFGTLPMTIFNLMLFIFIVMLHLRVYNRSRLESSLEEFVNGRDPRETCDNNVDDMDSLWEWYQGTGLGGPLGNCKKSTYNTDWDHCMMASRNILIGDLMIHQIKFDGTESKVWLLNSATGAKYLSDNPGSYLEAAQAAATSLQNNGGDHPDILHNNLIYNTYNEKKRIFTQVKVMVPLGKYGEVIHRINVDGVNLEPYPDWSMYGIDSIFVFLTVYITFRELQQACNALALGCGEFRDYWEFWNVIDWVQIIARFMNIGAWYYVTMKMDNKILHDLVDTDTGKLKVDVMALSQSDLEAIAEAVQELRWAYYYLKCGLAMQTTVIVAKFFKAFNANPRLRVVTDTFKNMWVDMSHFLIIFSMVFLPFVLIGHILFGSDVTEFGSLTASISTGIIVMFGEFAWYADIPLVTIGKRLNSGKLVVALAIWYFIYMILIVQVLLNMILAIILEKYLDITTNLAAAEFDAPALWTQVRRYRQYRKDTQGYVTLQQIKRLLENDADPAHPDPIVTASSLMYAFPKMSIYQAIWLMCWLEVKMKVSETKALHQNDDDAHRVLEEKASEKIQEIFDAILGDPDANKGPKLKKMGTQDKSKKESDNSEELGRVTKLLAEVQTGVAKLRRDQAKLGGKIDDLTRVMPSRTGASEEKSSRDKKTKK